MPTCPPRSSELGAWVTATIRTQAPLALGTRPEEASRDLEACTGWGQVEGGAGGPAVPGDHRPASVGGAGACEPPLLEPPLVSIN